MKKKYNHNLTIKVDTKESNSKLAQALIEAESILKWDIDRIEGKLSMDIKDGVGFSKLLTQ